MHFAVYGSLIVVIKSLLDERDSTWAYVVRGGFSSLPYTPMVLAAVPSADDIRDA